MHYSGVDFTNVCICMHKVARDGKEVCCGKTPTAVEDGDGFLFKCREHHRGRMLQERDLHYEREIKMFADAMRYKLTLNSSRGKWEDTTIGYVMEKLRREVKELEEAIAKGSMVEILLEGADVANYAMIASHLAMREVMADVRTGD